jgi:hypothetical protein
VRFLQHTAIRLPTVLTGYRAFLFPKQSHVLRIGVYQTARDSEAAR